MPIRIVFVQNLIFQYWNSWWPKSGAALQGWRELVYWKSYNRFFEPECRICLEISVGEFYFYELWCLWMYGIIHLCITIGELTHITAFDRIHVRFSTGYSLRYGMQHVPLICWYISYSRSCLECLKGQS